MRRALLARVCCCAVFVARCSRAPATTTEADMRPPRPIASPSRLGGTPSRVRSYDNGRRYPPPWGVAVSRTMASTFLHRLSFNAGVSGSTSTIVPRVFDGFIPTGLDSYGYRLLSRRQHLVRRQPVRQCQPDRRGHPPGHRLGRHRTNLAGRPGLARRCPALRGDRRNTGRHIVDVASLSVVRTVDVGFAPNGFAVHPIVVCCSSAASSAGQSARSTCSLARCSARFTSFGTPRSWRSTGTHPALRGQRGRSARRVRPRHAASLTNPSRSGGAFGVGVTPTTAGLPDAPSRGLVQSSPCRLASSPSTITSAVPRRIAFSQHGHIAAVTNQPGVRPLHPLTPGPGRASGPA